MAYRSLSVQVFPLPLTKRQGKLSLRRRVYQTKGAAPQSHRTDAGLPAASASPEGPRELRRAWETSRLRPAHRGCTACRPSSVCGPCSAGERGRGPEASPQKPRTTCPSAGSWASRRDPTKKPLRSAMQMPQGSHSHPPGASDRQAERHDTAPRGFRHRLWVAPLSLLRNFQI